jgi:hypothetical protein
MFQNPNLMDEWLDFGILSILKSWGIAILIKSYIKPHVKILKNTNVDYQRVNKTGKDLWIPKKIYSSVLLIIHLFLLNTLRS